MRVPQVVLVDVDSGIIGIEWIDGKSVRSVLGADEEMVENGSAGGEGAGGGGGERGESKSSDTAEYGVYGNLQGGFIFIHHHPSTIHPSTITYHLSPITYHLSPIHLSIHHRCLIISFHFLPFFLPFSLPLPLYYQLLTADC